ncbi:MAG: hypothetical protein KJO08_07175, partial [Gammaproteobacteria bacterium]|nr:hypothetical protein [Gammaproteobacteria bacterium]
VTVKGVDKAGEPVKHTYKVTIENGKVKSVELKESDTEEDADATDDVTPKKGASEASEEASEKDAASDGNGDSDVTTQESGEGVFLAPAGVLPLAGFPVGLPVDGLGLSGQLQHATEGAFATGQASVLRMLYCASSLS